MEPVCPLPQPDWVLLPRQSHEAFCECVDCPILSQNKKTPSYRHGLPVSRLQGRDFERHPERLGCSPPPCGSGFCPTLRASKFAPNEFVRHSLPERRFFSSCDCLGVTACLESTSSVTSETLSLRDKSVWNGIGHGNRARRGPDTDVRQHWAG